MGKSTSVTLFLILTSAACGFPRPVNIATVGGNVRGLWQGADGVALRLQATGLDTLLNVTADAPLLVQGDISGAPNSMAASTAIRPDAV